MYKIGDICYFLESNIHVLEGTVRSCAGGKYVIQYGRGKGRGRGRRAKKGVST